ncbi:hypothetical protein AWB78_08166 [Caballeronia calidae]|uniref:XRE family transcriptional regulator n=1 Tax=Caballeronia calidae TaxID=1777139 RepID=A0A158EIC4_9BURK|nr:hypothetical protein [Caballeronia calidae]SAL06639.1 hypothetical protein AWB78_08166 [Caballeronia calidae]
MASKKKQDAVTVTEYFDAQVALRQITLQQLSKDIGGVLKPNMLSMIRQGHTKIPLQHIGPIARALCVDALFLLKMAMNEYQPENWKAIQDIMGSQPVLTRNEIALLKAIREANPNNPKLNTEADEKEFAAVVAALNGDNNG